MRRVITGTYLLLVTLVLVGCNSVVGVTTNMTGTWLATFTNRADQNSKTEIRLQIQDSGTTLTGNATIANRPSPITGTRNGSSFEFSFNVLDISTLTVKGQTTSEGTLVANYTADTGANGPVTAVRDSN